MLKEGASTENVSAHGARVLMKRQLRPGLMSALGAAPGHSGANLPGPEVAVNEHWSARSPPGWPAAGPGCHRGRLAGETPPQDREGQRSYASRQDPHQVIALANPGTAGPAPATELSLWVPVA